MGCQLSFRFPHLPSSNQTFHGIHASSATNSWQDQGCDTDTAKLGSFPSPEVVACDQIKILFASAD